MNLITRINYFHGMTIREATSSWNGEGSFVFTSSSALVDCSDNGSCDEVFNPCLTLLPSSYVLVIR